MGTFSGTLRSNEIFSALFNMIISQQVFADNIKGTNARLVDMARVDGGLYGDTKLYYATDVLKSAPWLNDSEAANLLALNRPKAPSCQAIIMDKFRQISLTVDEYLSKRAWGSSGAFAEFNSIMLGWIRDTKRIYDSTTYNAFIGTDETATGGQSITISLPSGDTQEEENRLGAEAIAEFVANLIVALEDVSRQFNDYGYMRSYDADDLVFVWNSDVLNKIKKIDLPSIFHKEELIDKFGQYTLPYRYFGTKNTSGGTTSATNISVRALVEKDYTVSTVTTHVFPGELLPGGATYLANETYTQDDTIAFKVFHKRSVPFMSAFEVGTSFFNPKSLTENHYLTWGHNTLEHLKNYPMITVRISSAS